MSTVAALAVVLSSCGGGAEQSPKRTVLSSQGFTLAAGEGRALSIEVPEPGRLSASATWGPKGTDIDIYITDADCPGVEALVLGSCIVMGRGAGRWRPEVASADVLPGHYQAFVLALAETGDSGVVEFALTR